MKRSILSSRGITARGITALSKGITTVSKGLVTSAFFGLLSSYVAGQSAQDVAASFQRFDEAEERFEFLNEYCVGCHNYEDWAGELAFDLLDPETVANDAEVWEHAVRKLRGRLMPPAGELRPSNQQMDEFVAWMEDYLNHAGELKPYTGHVGLHRLNRKEYANAMRDLLGVEVDAEGLLPVDSAFEGFDNVAEALRVSPTFLEQSLTAARVVATQAVGNPEPRPGGATYRPTDGSSQFIHVDGLPLGTRGGLAVDHYFPADGEYMLNIGNLAQALWVFNQEYTHTLIATYDGERFFELEIGGGEDLRAIDQEGDPAIDAINARLKNISFNAEAGPHEIAVTFIHRSFSEFEGRLHSQRPGAGAQNTINIGSIELQGPFNPTGLSATPARNKIFVCYPQMTSEERACAQEVIANTTRKAFRGAIDANDLDRLMNLYDGVSEQNGFDIGVRRALSAILASPKFLYRLETAPEGVAPGSTYQLSDIELATRLSFFLWSSIPDEELLNLAEAGNLSRPVTLQEQVLRMLQDPKAETLVSNFAYQWLNMGGLDEIDPDPAIFAGIDFGVRDLFKEEMRLFVGSIFLENRNVVDLLTADYTYMNERLALHYGDLTVKGDNFRKVQLDDSIRFGLLGKGAVLMVSAYPDRTSPVLRGAYILEHITGSPPPDPPPNVEALTENKPGTKQLTVRERLEAHRANPSCNGCHGIMDPLGFALENFDAVGRFRTRDMAANAPIDTAGVLPDGRPITGTDDLRTALLEYPGDFVQNLTQKLMMYALGREVVERDMPTIRSVVDESSRNDYRFFDIVMGIVESDQFKQNEVPQVEGGAQEVAQVN